MEGGRESERICVSEQARERKSEREREREYVWKGQTRAKEREGGKE